MMRTLAALLLCFHLLAPTAAFAQTKDPTTFSGKTWFFVLGMALLGGFVNWYGKVSRGELPMWSVNHLIGELCTSAFAGLLCFFICEWAGFPPLLTGALTGICGHMGTRAVTMFEGWAERKFDTLITMPTDTSRPRANHADEDGQ